MPGERTKVTVFGVDTAAPGERRERISRLVTLLVGPQPEREKRVLSASKGQATQQTSGPISYSE